MRKKKIGIMGTHGVGKTTLALRLAYHYKKEDPQKTVSMLPEVARKCPFPINIKSSIQSQEWIFHKQMICEIEGLYNSDILVCDRTILDNLAYSEVLGFKFIVETYLEFAIGWLQTYSELYFLQPIYQIADDGIRSVDENFQRQVDEVLEKWIAEHSIPVFKKINKGGK